MRKDLANLRLGKELRNLLVFWFEPLESLDQIFARLK